MSDDYRTLSGGEKTPLKAYLASYTLITQLKTALPAYGDVGAFFIYSAPSDAERDIFDDSISYAQKERLRAFVRDAVENNTYSYNMQWRHAEIGGKAYLFRFYGGRGTYLVAMVPSNSEIEVLPARTTSGSFVISPCSSAQIIFRSRQPWEATKTVFP